MKHNKKRNTAFLYEALVREATKCVVEKDEKRKKKILSILKEHFRKGKTLAKELELYKSLSETTGLDPYTAEKLIYEVKSVYLGLGFEQVFDDQTALINDINKGLSKNVFTNFVPNYKTLATISQILNPKTAVKKRVLFEREIINRMSAEKKASESGIKPIDNLVYKTFVEKFNSAYGSLHEEQQRLLNNYVLSFRDNGIDFKIFLNEELGRLKKDIKNAIKLEEVKNDKEMIEKSKKVLELLESFKEVEINPEMLKSVLKVQTLVREIQS
jgi:hypothetical protein